MNDEFVIRFEIKMFMVIQFLNTTIIFYLVTTL